MAKQRIDNITINNWPKSHLDYKSNNWKIHKLLEESWFLDDSIFDLIDSSTFSELNILKNELEYFINPNRINKFSEDAVERLNEIKDYFDDIVWDI